MMHNSVRRRTFPGLLGLGLATLLLTGCETINEGPTPVISAVDSSDPQPELSVEQMLPIAAAAERSGDHGNALGIYQRVTERAPTDIRALKGQGRVLGNMGAAAESEQAWRKAVALDARDPEALRGLAGAEVAIGRADLAAAHYEAALGIDPRDGKALNGLGVLLDRQSKHGEAQARYQQALDIDPADVSAANNLALSLALSGQIADSLRRFEALMQSHGNVRRVRQNYAVALGLAGQLDKYREVASRDLDEKSVRNNLEVFAALNGQAVPGAAPLDLGTAVSAEPRVEPNFAVIDEEDASGLPAGGAVRPGPLPRIVAPGGVVLGQAPPTVEAPPPAPVRAAPPVPRPEPDVDIAAGATPDDAAAVSIPVRTGAPPGGLSPNSLSQGFAAGDAALSAAMADSGPVMTTPGMDELFADGSGPSTISGSVAVPGRVVTGDVLAQNRISQTRIAQARTLPQPDIAPAPELSPVAAPSGGDRWVQVGAYPSRDEAERVLDRLKSRAGDTVGSVPSRLEPMTRNGMKLVRLRFGPFASGEAADRFCSSLKARNTACFVPARGG